MVKKSLGMSTKVLGTIVFIALAAVLVYAFTTDQVTLPIS